jgi:hypothetical protein
MKNILNSKFVIVKSIYINANRNIIDHDLAAYCRHLITYRIKIDYSLQVDKNNKLLLNRILMINFSKRAIDYQFSLISFFYFF